MWQEVVIVILLVGAALYTLWRLYRLLTGKNEVCRGCPLADNCTKKNSLENCGSGRHNC